MNWWGKRIFLFFAIDCYSLWTLTTVPRYCSLIIPLSLLEISWNVCGDPLISVLIRELDRLMVSATFSVSPSISTWNTQRNIERIRDKTPDNFDGWDVLWDSDVPLCDLHLSTIWQERFCRSVAPRAPKCQGLWVPLSGCRKQGHLSASRPQNAEMGGCLVLATMRTTTRWSRPLQRFQPRQKHRRLPVRCEERSASHFRLGLDTWRDSS